MKIVCRKKSASESKKDAIVIPVIKYSENISELAGGQIISEIEEIIDEGYFTFEDKEIKNFLIKINGKIKSVYLINIPKEIDEVRYYIELGSKFGKRIKSDKISNFSLIAFEDIYDEKAEFNMTKSFIEGIYFGTYSFDKCKTSINLNNNGQEENGKKQNGSHKHKNHTQKIEEIEIISNSNKLKKYVDDHSKEWRIVFDNIDMARDLTNMPANKLNTEEFASFIKSLENSKLSVEILGKKELLENNLNLIYNVGKGSENQPKLAKISYTPNNINTNIALVGKGVMFDSGGTNLKPTGSIEAMKTDMAGAAVMLAVTKLISELSLPVNIYCYIPIVENTIGTSAYRPSDIIMSASGKTIEVLNTDAEGRLILADALYTATKTEPALIIDAATLTGACVVALGSFCAGMMSNRKFLSKHMMEISDATSEDLWEMPLYEGYAERIKGKNADLQNISKKKGEAGTIIGGLFLREFVDNYPWIHLDIAGPAYLEETHPIFGDGATGFGIRLITEFIKTYYINKK